ncbi:scarecrow-like protein 14 [Zingiber officinale]|uniref:Uncharacterized protein n=1 Tax=Zingiber officinale TaxID=94328 RepID=A0A8J5FSK7_ZINOF|nr:scarecrow-like protein 14 [Zingiber officinale]XP_042412593.1 scarecrow-like protein 14 [Zingiber officinale]KAG6493059.1 hypothetical protein ZIOFF_048033 [Zingiber officinale]
MNQFQYEEFFIQPSDLEDLWRGNFPITSVTDIQDGHFHYLMGNHFLDENDSPSTSYFSSALTTDHQTSSLSPSSEIEVPELSSDTVFSYISQMLLEENMDDKFDVYPEDPALLAAEKPFYEILSESYPPLHDQNSSPAGGANDGVLAGDSWPYDPLEYHQLQTDPVPVDYSAPSRFSSAIEDSAFSVDDLLAQSAPAWQFQQGPEEARRFLPSDEKLVIDLEANGCRFPPEPAEERNSSRGEPVHASRGRKIQHEDDDLDLQEGRNNKQPAFSNAGAVNSKFFDDFLLCGWDNKCKRKSDRKRSESENDKASRSSNGGGQAKASSSAGKGRGRKQPKEEVIDLRTLLIHCAQSVAIDDRRSANDLLKQIRQHASPTGDANQRLAACFADGLEARLSGTGSQVYRSIVARGISTVNMLKAYRCYMSACPIHKISYFFANRTIMNVAKDAARLHIIDFGIYHGFQWPCFIRRLADRPGGPPRLRLTGIDVPRPGFRPTERVDETGQRLSDYARRFGVPFEFQAIAIKWETIRIDDLNIADGEMLVVNSLFQFNNLMDETVLEESPRDAVLRTIRDLNPSVYICAIVNGSYNSPFFVTRFREVLFHYSSLFDMIETNVSREDEVRLLIESNIFGRDALNIIACEGAERVERPETYKKWQVRNLRAGLKPLPLSPDMIKTARETLKEYHKDFVIDVDGQWLLQGWKGRISHALSLWKSNNAANH